LLYVSFAVHVLPFGEINSFMIVADPSPESARLCRWRWPAGCCLIMHYCARWRWWRCWLSHAGCSVTAHLRRRKLI